jgi:hypothetical protein
MPCHRPNLPRVPRKLKVRHSDVTCHVMGRGRHGKRIPTTDPCDENQIHLDENPAHDTP